MMKRVILFLLLSFQAMAADQMIDISDFYTSGKIYQLADNADGDLLDYYQAMADKYSFLFGFSGNPSSFYSYPSSSNYYWSGTNFINPISKLSTFPREAQVFLRSGPYGNIVSDSDMDSGTEWNENSKALKTFGGFSSFAPYAFGNSWPDFRSATNWPAPAQIQLYALPYILRDPEGGSTMYSGDYLGPWLFVDTLRIAKSIKQLKVQDTRPDWGIMANVVGASIPSDNPASAALSSYTNSAGSNWVSYARIATGTTTSQPIVKIVVIDYIPGGSTVVTGTVGQSDVNLFAEVLGSFDFSQIDFDVDQVKGDVEILEQELNDHFTNEENYSTNAVWGESVNFFFDWVYGPTFDANDSDTWGDAYFTLCASGTHAFKRIWMAEKEGWSLVYNATPIMSWGPGRVYAQGADLASDGYFRSVPQLGGRIGGNISIINNISPSLAFTEGITTTNTFAPYGQYVNPMDNFSTNASVSIIAESIVNSGSGEVEYTGGNNNFYGIVIEHQPRITITE